MRTVVLVHGAWHGPWCWAAVLAGLDERGIASVAVDLPGPDLHADADHVRGVLDGLDGPAVLVGHSYGGAVITDAGTHPAAEHLVYLAAYVPDAGESVSGLARQHGRTMLADAIIVHDDATMTLDPGAVAALYDDCAPVDVERALHLLRPQASACFVEEPRSVAWRHRPVTYVVCAADRAVPPSAQRAMAERIPGAAVVELPGASHSPFLSRPGDLVELLAGLA